MSLDIQQLLQNHQDDIRILSEEQDRRFHSLSEEQDQLLAPWLRSKIVDLERSWLSKLTWHSLCNLSFLLHYSSYSCLFYLSFCFEFRFDFPCCSCFGLDFGVLNLGFFLNVLNDIMVYEFHFEWFYDFLIVYVFNLILFVLTLCLFMITKWGELIWFINLIYHGLVQIGNGLVQIV